MRPTAVLAALALPLAAAFSPSAPSLLAGRRPALSTFAGRSAARVAPCMVSKEGIEAKAQLLKVISDGDGKTVTGEMQIDALMATLSKEGTKFDRKVADGDWALVFERDGKNSPTLQKAPPPPSLKPLEKASIPHTPDFQGISNDP
ncbi:hypothetical protein T484DRAFT_1838196 [Baffinella frigidus]|nr:hypothetical protein T484DRAFT_1838196 [Cryptophyta sp. CCMP2293]